MRIMDNIFRGLLIIGLLFGLIIVVFGPPKLTVTDTNDISDTITDEQIARVEEICRRYVALWEADLELYKETLNSDIPKVQEIHTRVKTRMNEIADSYNLYILTNGYVFNGTLPDGIYAYIERIEEE